MCLIGKFKKYFCCTTREEDRSGEVALGNLDMMNKGSDLLELVQNPDQRIFFEPAGTMEKLAALTSAEVFESTDSENDDMFYYAGTYFRIAHLPPPAHGKPTLVLDLDNTLIFSTVKEPKSFDHRITVNYNGKAQNVWIIERPGLQDFLDHVAQKYEVVLFTAGIMQYGTKIMRKIDRNKRISYFLDRRFCTPIGKSNKNQDFFSKDIRILGRDLSRILIVDDRDYSFCFDVPNGILVPTFNGDPEDRCLYELRDYLDYCCTLEDMRCRFPFDYHVQLYGRVAEQ